MDGKNEIRKISLAGFFPAVVAMKAEDWRLVQICAVTVDDGYEMSYILSARDMIWSLSGWKWKKMRRSRVSRISIRARSL